MNEQEIDRFVKELISELVQNFLLTLQKHNLTENEVCACLSMLGGSVISYCYEINDFDPRSKKGNEFFDLIKGQVVDCVLKMRELEAKSKD